MGYKNIKHETLNNNYIALKNIDKFHLESSSSDNLFSIQTHTHTHTHTHTYIYIYIYIYI